MRSVSRPHAHEARGRDECRQYVEIRVARNNKIEYHVCLEPIAGLLELWCNVPVIRSSSPGAVVFGSPGRYGGLVTIMSNSGFAATADRRSQHRGITRPAKPFHAH